jgi:hypothetical protein
VNNCGLRGAAEQHRKEARIMLNVLTDYRRMNALYARG